MDSIDLLIFKDRLTLGMLIENRKTGFRRPAFDFENQFSIIFFKIIFSIENCMMLKRNSWKDKFLHLLNVYEL